MHRFTEPTPTSLAGHAHVEVFIDSWEIECCAPPPVVGEPSTWTLRFASASGRHFSGELDRDRTWDVSRYGASTCLVDDLVLALWSEFDGPPPMPGRSALRGWLSGTVHGPVPEGIPRVSGVVQRVRLASEVFVLHETREIRPVPGTFALADVSRSPGQFSTGDRPIAPGIELAMQTGVLLDLAVPLG